MLFLGFIALTLRVRPGAPGATMPNSLRALIAYVIAMSTLAGALGVDLWPFAAWRFAAYAVGDNGSFMRIVGVDASGQEHLLDDRAMQPLEAPELWASAAARVERMSREEGVVVLGFLLERAQDGLARARAGHPIGTFSRFLGPFAAPLFQKGPEPWSDHERLPSELVALRVYREEWRVTGNTAHIERRVLIADSRQ